MSQEPGYSRKAREFIEGLTPPPFYKMPESFYDTDSDHEQPSQSTPPRPKPLEKGLSHHSIKKKMNPLERNISLWSYRKPAPTEHKEVSSFEKSVEVPIKECAYLDVPQDIRDEPTDRKKILLKRLEDQYETMKHKLDGSNPKSHRPRPRPMATQEGVSVEQFHREIGTKKVQQSGVQYFADLYMIKKYREMVLKNTLLEKVQKKYKPQLPPIEPAHGNANNIIDEWITRLPQQKEFFEDIKLMGSNARKKAIKDRGPLANIYYQLAALNSDQKRNMRRGHKLGENSPFKDLL